MSKVIPTGCSMAQGFGGNANPFYNGQGLKGHPGEDIHCGWGSPIPARYPGYVYSTYPVAHPASDGYTAVFTIVETALEVFELSYGHVSEIDVNVGDTVTQDQIIAKEGNHGVVYEGNTLITLAMQAAGDHRGAHLHYQKRPVIKTKKVSGHVLQTANGVYRDADEFYYQVYEYDNGYNGCTDPVAPLFNRNLFIGLSGYDVYLLQKALIIDGCLDAQYQTGYFGTLTFAAVRKYQTKYGILSTGLVGPLTRANLNAKYPIVS